MSFGGESQIELLLYMCRDGAEKDPFGVREGVAEGGDPSGPNEQASEMDES